VPLELTGDFDGYNNAATMQIGLWINNDAEYIKMARHYAVHNGPERLALRLLHILADDWHNRPGSAAAAVYGLFQNFTLDEDSIDWAQICYSLVLTEPDDKDLDWARRMLAARPDSVGTPGEAEVWKHAYALNATAAEWIALRGISK